MNSSRFATSFGILIAVLMVAGVSVACTPKPVAPPAVVDPEGPRPEVTKSEPATVDMTWADATPIKLLALDAAQARPAVESDFQVTQTLTGEWEGEQVLPMAMGPEDQVLVTVVPDDNFDGATNLLKKHERVGILQGEEVTILDTFRSGETPRQALSGTIAEGYAAWTETASTQAGTLDWRVWVQDLTSTDDPILVGTSQDSAEDSESPMMSPFSLTISSDRVFWHTQVALEDGVQENRVMSAALTGGDVHLETVRAGAPVAVEGGVAVLWMIDDNPIAVSNLETTGAVKELIALFLTVEQRSAVREFAGDGETLAFILDGAAYIFNVGNQQATRVGGTSAHGLAMCNNRATWTDGGSEDGLGDHQYVYNVATKDFVVIDTPQNLGAGDCSGDSLLWSQMNDKGTTITAW